MKHHNRILFVFACSGVSLLIAALFLWIGRYMKWSVFALEPMLPPTGDVHNIHDPIQCFDYGADDETILRITEVGFDSTDEWIEISNVSDSLFTGSLKISGAKSSTSTITSRSIAPGQSLLVGDQ
jgi:hypothetical protein